jgi:membrane-bound metal-dependent hydrolase YbcI (DUF457 family)
MDTSPNRITHIIVGAIVTFAAAGSLRIGSAEDSRLPLIGRIVATGISGGCGHRACRYVPTGRAHSR